MTNFERIKAMTIDEMAKYKDETDGAAPFCNPENVCEDGVCVDCIKAWLESEVQDG